MPPPPLSREEQDPAQDAAEAHDDAADQAQDDGDEAQVDAEEAPTQQLPPPLVRSASTYEVPRASLSARYQHTNAP